MSAVTDGITKGERDELRRIVRGDFKALTVEIEVRRAEMLAEIEKRIATRFMAHENKISEAQGEIAELIQAANTGVRNVVLALQRECEGYTIHAGPVHPPDIRFVREKRSEMRAAMIADLDARCAHARARMARQENDLLKKLASGALATQEARAFLAEIPKVAELVPASRLVELEAQFDADETGVA